MGRISHHYTSCLFQIIIVGLVAFCEPGIWTALNNLGAGGNASVSRPLVSVTDMDPTNDTLDSPF